ncbi:MAG: cadherin-like beta sandwich domain-containing protein [Nitrospira sp.]|nr:cadherin-like beta sandwich domain-containing protein [Nitrospira sp.]
MRRNLICPGQWFVTVLILAIGLTAYGCKDTVSVSEHVEVPLSSLTVTPGTLQPAFFSNTTNYTVNAPTSATSVTVTATPRDSTTTVTINGTITTQRSVTLGPPGSTTTIIIVLESQTGTESTYTVNVTRLLSSDNNLSALTVTANNVAQPLAPDFDASILDYTVNVANTVAQVTVAATKSDLNAVMQIGSVTVPAGTAAGSAPNIPLGGPGTQTVVSISVTAQSGGAPKTYTITVNRAASSDDTLSALEVTTNNVVQPLAPDFDASILNYTVNVANTVAQVTVAATKSDLNAVMQIGSVTVPAGTASGSAPNIPLGGPGTQTVVSIPVTAQSGGAPKTYAITVNRAAPASDNNLLALTVTPGSLVPDFTTSTTTYSVDVPNSVDSVTVSATKADPNAVMSGDVTAGAGVATGQETFFLIPLFPRTVSITVTAPNGDPKVYSITITRAFP